MCIRDSYLVFAKEIWSKCRPTADLCSGTRRSAEAEEAFSQLGAGQPPADPGSLPPREPCREEWPCPDVPVFDASTPDAPNPFPIPSDAGPRSDSSSTSNGGPRLAPVEERRMDGCGCRVPFGDTSSEPALFSASFLAMLSWRRRRRTGAPTSGHGHAEDGERGMPTIAQPSVRTEPWLKPAFR